MRELPTSTLRFDVVALTMKLLVLVTERRGLNEKWSGQLVIIDGGNSSHEVRSLALYLCDPLVQCSDVRSGRIGIVQPCHFVDDRRHSQCDGVASHIKHTSPRWWEGGSKDAIADGTCND